MGSRVGENSEHFSLAQPSSDSVQSCIAHEIDETFRLLPAAAQQMHSMLGDLFKEMRFVYRSDCQEFCLILVSRTYCWLKIPSMNTENLMKYH